MSFLSNILNPETTRGVSHSPSTPSPNTVLFPPPAHKIQQPDREVRVRRTDGPSTYDHEPHPDCPDTLACLPDTDGRPQHTLPVILRCAILGSPRKRLTIREIYAAMEAKYSYYKTAGPTWKQSVRHHLSLNRLFERQPRPVTDPGFGSYWTVNLAAPPGTKRPRKRGRGNKDANAAVSSSQAVQAAGPPGSTHTTTPTSPQAPGPSSEPVQNAKRRGRPSKSANDRGSTPLSSHEGEDDERPQYGDGPPESGDEYDSEDEVMPGSSNSYGRDSHGPPQFHPAHTSRPPAHQQMFSLPPIASLDNNSSSEVTLLERLQTEVDTLRRQSAEAVSVSLRLSEQLAQAQAEVSRSRAAVRDLEDMLEDETSRRKDAERLADEESKRRCMAEDAFSGRSLDHLHRSM
ncbi:hypothetical protein FA15DRAFT_663017 [Coprinopsis marcescibilis]|uniref:Fork-head domain-containing protein n=1 Tax=Coprinopsis marcescibilis TaxID=230819 RepID=A0A5C3LE25_COPMA|nr:hypothetical protein FA15DRAFT_663017 [Coprinopsis marcescibilis]